MALESHISKKAEFTYSFQIKLIKLMFKLATAVADAGDLLLYVNGKQLRSYLDGQLSLPHLFLGKPSGGSLPVLRLHSFTIHLTAALLESAKEEE